MVVNGWSMTKQKRKKKMREPRLLNFINGGHAGVTRLGPKKFDGRIYLTPGKRSPDVTDIIGMYEGENNRVVAQTTKHQLVDAELLFQEINPGPVDIPLKLRTGFANKTLKAAQKKDSSIVGGSYTSIHHNAASVPGGGWDDRSDKASGFVIWAHPKSKEGKELAKLIEIELVGYMDELDIKSRGIKYSQWLHECRVPKMPSVIVECGFMTNFGETNKLNTARAQYLLGKGIGRGIILSESARLNR